MLEQDAKLENDLVLTQTLRFVEIAETVKESGFAIEDVDYIFRHRFDPLGKYRFDQNTLLTLVKNLAAEIRRIEAETHYPC